MINFKLKLNLYTCNIIYHLYIVYKKLLINIIIYIICFLIDFYKLLYLNIFILNIVPIVLIKF